MSTIPRRWLLVALAFAVAASGFAVTASAGPSGSSPRPTKSVTISLYGNMTAGWGLTPTNMSHPGPALTVDQGDVITFTLFSQDSLPHTLVIDVNLNGVQDAGEPVSGQFTSPTTGVTFAYTANVTGTLQYYCGVHGPSIMKGPLTVNAATPPAGGNTTLLIVGGVIVLIVIVGAVAGMRMRKKKPGP